MTMSQFEKKDMYRNLAAKFMVANEESLQDMIIAQMDYASISQKVQQVIWDDRELEAVVKRVANEVEMEVANAIAEELLDEIQTYVEDIDVYDGDFVDNIAKYLEF